MARPASEQGDRDNQAHSLARPALRPGIRQASCRKPDGTVYRNTDEDWLWLSGVAGKAARWLGYIPFERIADNRNAEPIIHRKARVKPEAFVSIGLDVRIPDADDIEPMAIAQGFEPRQAFHFAVFGEKASLEDVLKPVASKMQADLYLPTGEISDTLVHRIAKDADDDGRPLGGRQAGPVRDGRAERDKEPS